MIDTDSIVVYGTSWYSNNRNLHAPEISTHNHEKDTLIPLHVLVAMNQSDVVRNIAVGSPDTNVFNLHHGLFAKNGIAGELTFKAGKGKLESKISINERCNFIGTDKAMGLLRLRVFPGADWRGKFFGISKKKWVTSYLALEPNSEVINDFQQLRDSDSDLDLARSQKVREKSATSSLLRAL